MKLNVDYHFHPNLPKNNRRKSEKVDKIWNAFGTFNLDAVLVTEHAYKDPADAYFSLKDQSLKNTKIFPGVECLTSEGIDMIVFSKKESIYDYSELLTPYNFSIDELVQFIAGNKDLNGFITHPYTPGTTSIVKIKGEEVARENLNSLGAIEVHNSAFDNVLPYLQHLPLSKVRRMKKTSVCPEEFYKDAKINFYAGGSDAHHVHEIGSHFRIDRKKDIFHSIINNSGGEMIVQKYSLAKIPYMTSTVFMEWLKKTNIKWR
jgi:hypothetical protein